MKNFLVFLIAIFLSTSSFAETPQLEKVKLAQFGQAKFLLYLPLYVAQEEGYFAEQGLDVEVKFAGNDDQIFAAVISGAVDYGMGDPVFTAIAAEKGFKAKTLAMLIANLGLMGYTNNSKISIIEKPEQLAGLRIGSFPAPSTTYTILQALKASTPSLSNMQIIQGQMGTQLAALEAGKTDIAVDLEPAVAIAESKGYRSILNLSKYTPPMAITGLMATEKHVTAHPDQAQRMVNALQKAVTAIYQTPDVALRTGHKLFPTLGDEVIKRAVDHMIRDALYPHSVVTTDEYWQRTIQSRLDSGELKKKQATSVAVDNRFAEKAFAQYGKK
jgi:NitT/TauT family transport system substrate-binding protein